MEMNIFDHSTHCVINDLGTIKSLWMALEVHVHSSNRLKTNQVFDIFKRELLTSKSAV